jgi:hypothetical protein
MAVVVLDLRVVAAYNANRTANLASLDGIDQRVGSDAERKYGEIWGNSPYLY